jgi:transposase
MTRPRLTDSAKLEAISMIKKGCSYKQIATTIGTSKSTIHNIIERYEQTGSVKERARSGRPRISTPREDRILLQITKKNKSLPSHQLAKNWKLSSGLTASSSLVRYRLILNAVNLKTANRKTDLKKEPTIAQKYLNPKKINEIEVK